MQQREVAREFDFQVGKFTVMNGVGLLREDSFRFVLVNARRQCPVRDGNMLRNIRDHFDALVDVLVKKVSAQLRIKNPGREHDQNEER